MDAPSLRAISMAMTTFWSYTRGIAWWNMSRATPEASGRRHWATTHFVLPRLSPGSQAKQIQWKNTRCLLAFPMAMAMRWYDTKCIAWWRGSRASLEATGRRHWVSIRTIIPPQATGLHSLKKWKKSARRADPLRIMRTRILAEVFHCTLNKITQKIGRKHRTPSEKEKKWLINSVKNHNKNKKRVKEVIAFVKENGGIEYTIAKMKDYQTKALDILNTVSMEGVFFPYSSSDI